MRDELSVSPLLNEILDQTLVIISEHDEFDAEVLERITALVAVGNITVAERVIDALRMENV